MNEKPSNLFDLSSKDFLKAIEDSDLSLIEIATTILEYIKQKELTAETAPELFNKLPYYLRLLTGLANVATSAFGFIKDEIEKPNLH